MPRTESQFKIETETSIEAEIDPDLGQKAKAILDSQEFKKLFKDAVHEFNDKEGIGLPLKDDGRIDMGAFRRKLSQRTFSDHLAKCQEREKITESIQRKFHHGSKDFIGELLERLFFIAFNRAWYNRRFITLRTAEYDDYVNKIDFLVLDAENQYEPFVAIDVTTKGGKVLTEDQKKQLTREEKGHIEEGERKLKHIAINGGEIKYGIKLSDGEHGVDVELTELEKLPAIMVSLNPDDVIKFAGDLLNEDEHRINDVLEKIKRDIRLRKKTMRSAGVSSPESLARYEKIFSALLEEEQKEEPETGIQKTKGQGEEPDEKQEEKPEKHQPLEKEILTKNHMPEQEQGVELPPATEAIEKNEPAPPPETDKETGGILAELGMAVETTARIVQEARQPVETIITEYEETKKTLEEARQWHQAIQEQIKAALEQAEYQYSRLLTEAGRIDLLSNLTSSQYERLPREGIIRRMIGKMGVKDEGEVAAVIEKLKIIEQNVKDAEEHQDNLGPKKIEELQRTKEVIKKIHGIISQAIGEEQKSRQEQRDKLITPDTVYACYYLYGEIERLKKAAVAAEVNAQDEIKQLEEDLKQATEALQASKNAKTKFEHQQKEMLRPKAEELKSELTKTLKQAYKEQHDGKELRIETKNIERYIEEKIGTLLGQHKKVFAVIAKLLNQEEEIVRGKFLTAQQEKNPTATFALKGQVLNGITESDQVINPRAIAIWTYGKGNNKEFADAKGYKGILAMLRTPLLRETLQQLKELYKGHPEEKQWETLFNGINQASLENRALETLVGPYFKDAEKGTPGAFWAACEQREKEGKDGTFAKKKAERLKAKQEQETWHEYGCLIHTTSQGREIRGRVLLERVTSEKGNGMWVIKKIEGAIPSLKEGQSSPLDMRAFPEMLRFAKFPPGSKIPEIQKEALRASETQRQEQGAKLQKEQKQIKDARQAAAIAWQRGKKQGGGGRKK